MDAIKVPLSPDVTRALDDIAARRNSSVEELAAQAVADFVRDEELAVAAIRQGIDDARAGRTTSHEVAMERLLRSARGA